MLMHRLHAHGRCRCAWKMANQNFCIPSGCASCWTWSPCPWPRQCAQQAPAAGGCPSPAEWVRARSYVLCSGPVWRVRRRYMLERQVALVVHERPPEYSRVLGQPYDIEYRKCVHSVSNRPQKVCSTWMYLQILRPSVSSFLIYLINASFDSHAAARSYVSGW